jgi:uncharacterized protein (DUF885 family)
MQMSAKCGFLALVVMIVLVASCNGQNSSGVATLVPTLESQTTALPETQSILTPAGSIESLGGREFDAFIEESYRRLLSRDPETVLELGLSHAFGVPTDQLTDISDGYIRQTQALEKEVLSQLQMFDRSSLTAEQQLTYDIYAWYLHDRAGGHEFMYNDYPINPTVFSVHLDLLQFFTDLRPVTNLQEAQDYISALSQVDTKFDQLLEGLKIREENGVVLPRFLVEYILGDLRDMAASRAVATPYYTAFESKLMALPEARDDEKTALLSAAEEAIQTAVISAYQNLVTYFEHLRSVATNDAGVWKFSDGDAYYAYTLRHHTSTDLTADQIHALGLQALEEIHAEMRSIFDQLGYPSEDSLGELYSRVALDSGTLSGESIVRGYEDIITRADQSLDKAFDLHPNIGVIVVGGLMGGYYMPPAVDGSRPGIFYAADTGIQPKFSMPTLAYHEAIPGHHFQIAIAQQLDLPSFRRGADFTAYVEGWALYAEHLARELGFYEGDPYGDLGRLQAQAFRAARLVVDTGLHAKKWSFDQAVNFMVENTGMPRTMMQGEVSRYITLPGQATAYYIGYMKILETRQRTMDELGEEFNLKEFHNVLLGNGAMPLRVLEQAVSNYLQTKAEGE